MDLRRAVLRIKQLQAKSLQDHHFHPHNKDIGHPTQLEHELLSIRVRMLGKSDGGSAFREVLADQRQNQRLGGPPHRASVFLCPLGTIRADVREIICLVALSAKNRP